MATLTIHLPDDKHYRLKEITQGRGLSVNKLIEELSTIVLDEFDAESRFKAMAAKGSSEERLKLLDKLNAS